MIYADHAATTKISETAKLAMLSAMEKDWYNPSSLYTPGQQASGTLMDARVRIARCLGCLPKEIYFTSGGSEADNQAILSAAAIGKRQGKMHIISTAFEHHAVLHTLKKLEKEGFEITLLDVGEKGIVSPAQVEKAIRPDTALVTVMYANNEIGTIQPISEIGAVCRQNGVLFHTDAVQAFCHVPINVDECHIDMLSSSAHKLNGPKGTGFLYIRTGLKTRSFIHGGAQERKRRGGTENTAGIVGFGKAVEIAMATMEERTAKEKAMRDHLIERVLKEIPFARLNGHPSQRLSNNANFAFQFIEGESMLIMLDMEGICGSSGSACTSGSLDPSHVLLAIGLPHEIAHGSLRLTLSAETTMEQIDFTVDCLKKIVERLRSMSPLYEDYIKKHPQQ